MRKKWCKSQTRKKWHKSQTNGLTKKGKEARSLVFQICKALSENSNGTFTADIAPYAGCYEGHIYDSRLIRDTEYDPQNDPWHTFDDCMDEPVGMLFFGGYFSKKKFKDARSKAWISLLEDCIGIGELKQDHTLTEHLKDFGPRLDFNCSSIEELKMKLKEYAR